MECEKCGTKLEKNKKFCPECGTKSEKKETAKDKKFCEECGNKIDANVKYCGECGHKTLDNKINIKTMSPKKKRIITITVIIIALLSGTFLTFNNLTTHESVAKEFCNTLINKNSNKLYEIVKVPESEFINKDNFKKAFDNVDDIVSCIPEEVSSSKGKVNYSFTIENSSGKTSVESFALEKTDKKKFIFFDEWKINIGELVRDKWQISVPKDSKLYIDGKEIKDKDKSKSSDSKDVYIIKDTLIGGTYKIKVTHDLYNTYEEDITPASSTTVKMELNFDISKEIDAIITTLYETALLDKDIEDFKKYVTSNYKEDSKTLITNIRDKVESSASYFAKKVEFQTIKLKDFSISNQEVISENKIKLRVNYSAVYKYKADDDSEFKEKENNYYLNIELVKENKTWLLDKAN